MSNALRSMTILAVVIFGVSALAAPPQEAAAPAPAFIEVRAHVTAEGRFVEDLTLADFQILEDGRSQPLISLELVRGGRVVRSEGGPGRPSPEIGRTYTLLFQAVDWDPKLAEAISHLFGTVLKPGDALSLVTPVKPYNLQKDALAERTKSELSKSMEDVLRKDILRGGGEYRELIRDLRRLIRAISGQTSSGGEDLDTDVTMESGGLGLEMQIDRYRQALMKLEGIRLVDEAKLLTFADSLKGVPGQKTVVLFYQREYRPEISGATLNRMMSLYQENFDIIGNLMDLFQFYNREKAFDADRVRKAFADSGVDFHFIFMEQKSQRIYGATMKEQSEDTYAGFVSTALATGGTSASSVNPAEAFKSAARVSSDYYLLTYMRGESDLPPGFRTFDVRVKRDGAKITAPLGYFSK